MDTRTSFRLVVLALPLVALAGCNRETAATSSDSAATSSDSGAAAPRISYADALQKFEAEQKKYDQFDKLIAGNAERQKQALDASDSAKAADLAASIDKLTKRQAEQKEKLAVAKKAMDEAYVRENPASSEDFDQAVGASRRPRIVRPKP